MSYTPGRLLQHQVHRVCVPRTLHTRCTVSVPRPPTHQVHRLSTSTPTPGVPSVYLVPLTHQVNRLCTSFPTHQVHRVCGYLAPHTPREPSACLIPYTPGVPSVYLAPHTRCTVSISPSFPTKYSSFASRLFLFSTPKHLHTSPPRALGISYTLPAFSKGVSRM